MKKFLFVLLVLSVVTVNAQVPSYVPTNGLVAYYPFNGNANDASGNGNNGVVNGATLTSDRFGNLGKAYGFDGVSKSIRITNNSSFNFLLNSDYTINIWYKIEQNPSGVYNLIGQGDGDGLYQNRFWRIYTNSNEIRTHIRGNNSDLFDTKNTSNISGIGQWHMVSMSRNFNSSLKMYVDGILVDMDSDITGIANQFTTTRDILIGSFFDSYSNQNINFMSGTLDDIAIYNRALTSSEIIELYKSNNVTILSNTNFTQITYSPALCMEKLNNGNLIVGSGNGNILLFDSTGNYSGIYHTENLTPEERYTSIRTSSNGNLITSLTKSGYNANYIKLNQDGTVLQNSSLTNGQSFVHDIIEGNSGNINVAGAKNCGGLGGGWDARITSYSSSMSSLWNVEHCLICGCPGSFCNYGDEIPYQEIIIGSNVYFAGYRRLGGSGCYSPSDGWIVKANNSGQQIWNRIFGGTGEDMFYKIKALSNGNIVASGFTTINGVKDSYIVCIDSLGNTVWTRTIDFGGEDVSHDVIICRDGNILITGLKSINTTPAIFATKLDLSGNIIWTKDLITSSVSNAICTTWDWPGQNLLESTNGRYVLSYSTGTWYNSNMGIGIIRFSENSTITPVSACIANITNNDTSICRGSSITLNAASVTDINGNVYPTVNIGTQTWMQKNLNVSKYKNGDIIPQVTNPTQWAALTTGAWCWYNNDSATYAATYGKLYNWYAVNDARGLAPEGWHVPNDGEWNKMVKYLDANADTSGVFLQSSIAGGALKEEGLLHWSSPNYGARNSSGFTGLPGGYRDNNGQYSTIGLLGLWWSSLEYNLSNSYKRGVGYNDSGFGRDYFGKTWGFSVRALRNTPTYLWSTGATTPSISVSPTVTTKYYCTVSDGINTCKDSVTVTVSTITTNLITADTIKVCGTSTTISATSGLASYAWSNGANTASTTVTSSGWYKCTATNGACTAKDSVYVSLFNPKITQNDTTVCAGTALTLTVNNNTTLSSSLPANLRNGLVGYWPFNGNANDESGNGNNGTVNGATLTSDRFGNVGKAYGFDGVNDLIQIQPNSSLTNLNGSISICSWVNCQGTTLTPSYSNQDLQGIFGPSSYLVNDGGFLFRLADNSYDQVNNRKYNFGVSLPSGSISSSNIVNNNSWDFVVASYDGNNLKIYRNGVLDATQTSGASLTQAMNTTGRYYTIGQCIDWLSPTVNFQPFNGKLDDIAIYNRAISASEVQQIYNGASYLWSTTATTQSISVNPTATTSYIATVSNGINTCKDTVKITVANITSLAPTTIFGTVDVCASIGADTASVPVNYKINKIANAASYVWTVPVGATLLSGQGDTSIMVRFRSSFVSGNITVKSVSVCNISSAIKSLTVYKRVAAVPTSIQNQFSPTSIVAVTNVTGSVSQIYRIKKVLYATSYNWNLNRGTNATITHINSAGVNDTAVIVTFASCFVKDTLSVKSVTPCSISAAKTVIMSSSTTPATVAGITTVGGDFAVCIGSSKTFTAVASTPTSTQVNIASYRWTKPLNTTITSASSDSSSITVSFNAGFTGGSISAKGVSSCGVIGTTATTAILQYLPPTPLSIGSSTNTYNACINSSVTYTALVGTATTAQAQASVFRWTKPNNTTITSATADSSSITLRFNTGYIGGVISVKGQSRCGAQSAARSQALTHTGCALGTKMSLPITTTNTASFEVSLYPNPTTNEFKLFIKNNAVVGTNKPTKAIVKVIDVQGRMMKSFTTNTNQVIAIGNELKSGVYMVEVRVGEDVKTIRAVKF